MRRISFVSVVFMGGFAALGLTADCLDSPTVYYDMDCYVGTVAIPDTIGVNDSLVVRVSGLSPAGDCCHFDGIRVSITEATWDLRPVARCRKPLEECRCCSNAPFDQSVTLPPLDANPVYVRVQIGANVVLDSVVVRGR
jgi:hypothetical protein